MVMSPQEREVVAYHECGHALVGWLLKTTDALLKVTIVPRTNKVLGFASYMPQDQRLFSEEELFERMCMALGGRVAESLTFNKVTTGAQNDLDKVTKMAYAQIRQFGMNEKVGLVSFDEEQTGYGSKKPFSQRLAHVMDDEARRLVFRAYKKTEDVISANKDKLEKLAMALLAKETLNYKEVEELIGPPNGEKKLIGPEEFEVVVDSAGNTDATNRSNGPSNSNVSAEEQSGAQQESKRSTA